MKYKIKFRKFDNIYNFDYTESYIDLMVNKYTEWYYINCVSGDLLRSIKMVSAGTDDMHERHVTQ